MWFKQLSLFTLALLGTCMYLLIENTQALDISQEKANKLVFSKQGRVASTTSYAHASFDVNISDARASIDLSREILDRITNKVSHIMDHWHNTTGLNKRSETIWWDMETSKVNDEFHYQELQLNILADSITYQQKRQPRQILVAGLAAVSGLLLGGSLFNLPEISNLRATMTSNAHNIELISHNLGLVKDTLSASDKILHGVSANIHRLEEKAHEQEVKKNLILLRYNMQRLIQNQRYRYNTFSSGLSSLLEGHLTSHLVNLLDAENSMSLLKKKAEAQGLNLVFPHPLDFYKARTTLFRTDEPGLLAVFVHIPLYRPPLYHLFKYIPLPILVSSHNKTATPLPDHEYLIVNPQRNLYQTLTEAEFATCERHMQNDITFCLHTRPYRKDFNNNCLASLYLNDGKAITNTCRFSVSKAGTETVLAEDDSSFHIYSPTRISVRISCDSSDTTIVVHGYHHLRVNSSCAISTPHFYGRVEASIKQRIAVSTTHIDWNATSALSPLLEDLNLNFTDLDTTLSSHSNLLTSLQDDLAVLSASVAATSHSLSLAHYHSFSTTATVVIVLSVLIAAGIYVYRRYRQRTTTANTPATNQP